MIRRLARRGRWAALAVIALAGSPAPTAEAGTYTVWSCRGPDGAPVSTAAWRLGTFDEPAGGVLLDDACAAGGSLELALSSVMTFPSPSKPRAMATFDLPPGGRIVGYTLWRSLGAAAAVPGGGYQYAAAVRERSAGTNSDSGCASTLAPPSFDCSTLGNPADPLDDANRVERTGLQLEGLQVWAGCISAGCDPPFAPPSAEVRLFRSTVAVEDLAAPSTPRLAGSLTRSEPVTGTGTLVVESDDAGGGIAAMTLSIDGGAAQRLAPAGPSGSCREPYTLPQPCPLEVARAFSVDTDALAEGWHSAVGTVVDVAGNVTSFGPLPFRVARPPGSLPPSAPDPVAELGNGRPAVNEPRLRFRRELVEHARGRRARINGTLRTATGVPIAGARLTVERRELASAADRRRTVAPVVTSSTGRFTVLVPGEGAQRVSVSFAPTLGAAPTVTETVTVRTRTSLSIARSRARLERGEKVVLRGRLRGAGAASAGAVVELQAIVSGRWRAVATVPAARDGDYRWRYRFRHVTRDTLFSFRALVRRTPGWPWPTLRSRRVHVRVDGA